MKKIFIPLLLLGTLSLAHAQEPSPIQSAARPYNLDIVAPVQLAASDEASKLFQSEVLPGMLDFIDQNLGEKQTKFDNQLASIALDPSKLVLGADSNVRVYFLGEGAGYRNTLGFSTTGEGPLSPDAELIFPNASSSVGYSGSGALLRSTNEPLLAGDFVDLGTQKAGTALDFFLIANGASGGKQFFSTIQSLNSDGLVHAVSFTSSGSSYLIIGFEDLVGGGDRDYNDLVFAVEIGQKNVEMLPGIAAPEPSLALGAMLSLVAFLGFSRRRSPQ